MKVSTKGRYGLRALADMAAQAGQTPVPLAVIAKRQHISLNYLEQVFGQLRKAGILKSIKGPNGGYMLAREAKDITVKEILEVLEGPFSIVDQTETEDMDTLQKAIKSLVWDEIDKQVNGFLAGRTLWQLAEEYQGQKQGEDMMFYI